MDVVESGLARTTSIVRRLPSLRIVALCAAKRYSAIPSFLRCAFVLSTFLSAAATQRPVDLRRRDATTGRVFSTVVNHTIAEELGSDSEESGSPMRSALLDSTHLSPWTERYLYDIVVGVRGTLVPNTSTAAKLVSRVPQMLQLLRLAALMFSASDDRTEDTTDGDGSVVVTPTDVACFMPHFAAHLLVVFRQEVAQPSPPMATAPLLMWDACVVSYSRRALTAAAADAHTRSSRSVSLLSHPLMQPFAVAGAMSPEDSSDGTAQPCCPHVGYREAAGLVMNLLRSGSCSPPG
jgi:hypothetical protein